MSAGRQFVSLRGSDHSYIVFLTAHAAAAFTAGAAILSLQSRDSAIPISNWSETTIPHPHAPEPTEPSIFTCVVDFLMHFSQVLLQMVSSSKQLWVAACTTSTAPMGRSGLMSGCSVSG